MLFDSSFTILDYCRLVYQRNIHLVFCLLNWSVISTFLGNSGSFSVGFTYASCHTGNIDKIITFLMQISCGQVGHNPVSDSIRLCPDNTMKVAFCSFTQALQMHRTEVTLDSLGLLTSLPVCCLEFCDISLCRHNLILHGTSKDCWYLVIGLVWFWWGFLECFCVCVCWCFLVFGFVVGWGFFIFIFLKTE